MVPIYAVLYLTDFSGRAVRAFDLVCFPWPLTIDRSLSCAKLAPTF